MASLDHELLNKQIGSRIKQRRTKNGMTQVELAKRVGLSRTSIANIEAGQQCPPLPVLYSICHELGVEPNSLLPAYSEVAQTPSGLAYDIAAELKQMGAGKVSEHILNIFNEEKKRAPDLQE
jgi:transcriptional regulator with XRE-family HTH domain